MGVYMKLKKKIRHTITYLYIIIYKYQATRYLLKNGEIIDIFSGMVQWRNSSMTHFVRNYIQFLFLFVLLTCVSMEITKISLVKIG